MRRASRDGEDARPDDDADPEDREVRGGQLLLELVLRLIAFSYRLLDGLSPQHIHARTSWKLGSQSASLAPRGANLDP